MDRIEKVLKGLECCLWGSDWDKKCDECPYEATEDEKKHVDWDCHLNGLREDALALLKEQEARVLTLEDFDRNPKCDGYGRLPCWLESREPLIASAWNIWNVDDFIRPRMKNFRPWTTKPTDEQRKAVKWE